MLANAGIARALCPSKQAAPDVRLAFSTMLKLSCGGQFYWWRKLEYLEKTTNLSQVTVVVPIDNVQNYILISDLYHKFTIMD
jgi:hypothetical protein